MQPTPARIPSAPDRVAAALGALASEAQACFDAACVADPPGATDLRIAGHDVRVRCADAELADALLPALLHHEAGGSAPRRLEIRAWHGPAHALRAPDALREHWARGGFARSERFRAHPNGAECIVTVYDSEASIAWWWIPDLARLPGWEAAAPFRPILQWWARDHGGQLAHGAAVGRNGAAVLLAGRGGSGKSTTALAALRAGMAYAGDDYVLVREEADAWRLHSLYGAAKVLGDRLDAWFPAWRPHARRCPETQDKWIVPVSRLAPEALVPSMRLAAIVVPRISGRREPAIEDLSAQAAMLALAPSSVFQLAGTGAAAVRTLAALVRAVPAYRLDLGHGSAAANAAALDDLLTQCGGGSR